MCSKNLFASNSAQNIIPKIKVRNPECTCLFTKVKTDQDGAKASLNLMLATYCLSLGFCSFVYFRRLSDVVIYVYPNW